jgi:Lipid desaturase domain
MSKPTQAPVASRPDQLERRSENARGIWRPLTALFAGEPADADERRMDEQASKPIIVITVLTQIVAIDLVARHPDGSVWLAVVAFLVSGFLADLLAGLMHFGFDYVFPGWMPILGPIAKEFREHYEESMLDPSTYVVNFTKVSYGSFLAGVLVSVLSFALADSAVSFFVIATLMGTCVWVFFFHQIHSYAHMGSHLLPEDFNRRSARNRASVDEAGAHARIQPALYSGADSSGDPAAAAVPPDPQSGNAQPSSPCV